MGFLNTGAGRTKKGYNGLFKRAFSRGYSTIGKESKPESHWMDIA